LCDLCFPGRFRGIKQSSGEMKEVVRNLYFINHFYVVKAKSQGFINFEIANSRIYFKKKTVIKSIGTIILTLYIG